MKQQPLLQRGQRQNIGNLVLPLQLIDLLLTKTGRCDIRRASTRPHRALYLGADAGPGPNHSRPSRLTRRVIQCRGRPGPVGGTAGRRRCRRAPALSSTVCGKGIGTAAAALITDTSPPADPPPSTGSVGGISSPRGPAAPDSRTRSAGRTRPDPPRGSDSAAAHSSGRSGKARSCSLTSLISAPAPPRRPAPGPNAACRRDPASKPPGIWW